MDRTVETKNAIEKAAPGKFKWIENNEIRSWDIGDETTGFHKMDREGFRKVENYFQDHPNETKLPDSFFLTKDQNLKNIMEEVSMRVTIN